MFRVDENTGGEMFIAAQDFPTRGIKPPLGYGNGVFNRDYAFARAEELNRGTDIVLTGRRYRVYRVEKPAGGVVQALVDWVGGVRYAVANPTVVGGLYFPREPDSIVRTFETRRGARMAASKTDLRVFALRPVRR